MGGFLLPYPTPESTSLTGRDPRSEMASEQGQTAANSTLRFGVVPRAKVGDRFRGQFCRRSTSSVRADFAIATARQSSEKSCKRENAEPAQQTAVFGESASLIPLGRCEA